MRSLASRVLSGIVCAAFVTSLASAQNAVTFWNSIAVNAALTAKSTGGMTGLFLAYSNLAAFDAVNAIHPGFTAYGGIMPAAAPDASDSAAVAAAAHDVLVHYFPAQAPMQSTEWAPVPNPRTKAT